ncbi:MAG: hypothetical protein H6655_02695 [Ardenticatenaceae bacterium]|nr:hypothetical protein [Ardenticatenaceae bacterium]
MTNLLNRLETLGYYSLPRSHAGSPGFGGLLVVLRQQANGHQPESIHLHLHDWDGQTPRVSLHANGNQSLSHIVCPGPISIHSRQKQEATFFSFGGTLESEVFANETVFSFRSPAPILELSFAQDTIADQMADETEALMARAAATHQISTNQLLNRLVSAGAEAVYVAVLQALLIQVTQTAVSHQPDFVKMLNQERTWFQQSGRWPHVTRDLETLLSP